MDFLGFFFFMDLFFWSIIFQKTVCYFLSLQSKTECFWSFHDITKNQREREGKNSKIQQCRVCGAVVVSLPSACIALWLYQGVTCRQNIFQKKRRGQNDPKLVE